MGPMEANHMRNRERVLSLEEERRVLIAAWEALDRAATHVTGKRRALAASPALRQSFQLLGNALTLLDTEQREALAAMQSAEAGWKGGESEDLYGTHLIEANGNRRVRRPLPGVPEDLYRRARLRAEEMGMSLREFAEDALVRYLSWCSREHRYGSLRRCRVCRRQFAPAMFEQSSAYRNRATCGSTCAHTLRLGRRRLMTDALVSETVGAVGYRKAADALGCSTRALADRMNLIRALPLPPLKAQKP